VKGTKTIVIASEVQTTTSDDVDEVKQERPLMEYERMIIDLANKNGLGSYRKETIEQWFKLIHFFEERYQPPVNVLLWYKAGKQHSVEKLIAGGVGDGVTVKYEKEHIDDVRSLMQEI
jgi:hypothetical protein